ncbi:MAG: cardiolipin synthase [Planctomycetes bacterium]|nr:cardiolipin synthase [Planctomycetota bacterium]
MQPHYWFLAEWSIRIGMAAIVVMRRRTPSAALAWLVVISFVPVVGAAAYLLIGENRLGSTRSRAYRAVVARIRAAEGDRRRLRAAFHADRPEHHLALARLAEALGAGSAMSGGAPQLLTDAAAFGRVLVADIDAARHHCHLLYFIFLADDHGVAVAQALTRAAQRGVACRLLVDGVGSRDFLASALRREIEQQGVVVVAALPVNVLRATVARLDLRNHRKLAIVDGGVAYVGSHNVANPVYPHKARFGAWVDASARLTGPVVNLLQEVFTQDWVFNGGELAEPDAFLAVAAEGIEQGGVPVQVLPTGPASKGGPLVDVLAQAIATARRKVVLTTPYFVPNEALLTSLRSAALRGIEIELIVPRRSDHAVAQAAGRSHYGFLLDVGVAIHEYEGGLLHAKTLTVDDDLAMIGSANLDLRSFLLNFELAVLVYDRDFTAQMQALHRGYLTRCRRLSVDGWRRRGRLRQAGDNVAQLLSPLL